MCDKIFESDAFIQHIKEQLDKSNMSAMVGAGFSKNANNKYPSWTELLIDMVVELYNISTKNKKIRKKEAEKIIDEKGYFEIVDEYIKRKGHRESIDIFIDNLFFKLSLKKSDTKLHSELLCCKWNNVYTTNYDKLLENSNSSFEVVDNSSRLQIRPTRRIIKLHGSLRKKEDKDKKVFGFDGCRRHHYIISKEDYETYPQRHEAFTQLMRIALLQEKFCLFGFSATDPNFLSWINWVRDILEKKTEKKEEREEERSPNDPKSYSVFLIDVLNDRISESKEQHLFNLGIKVLLLKPLFPKKSPKIIISELIKPKSFDSDLNSRKMV